MAERLRAARKTYAVFTMTMIWRYKDSAVFLLCDEVALIKGVTCD